MSTHNRRRPKLPPGLERLFKEIVELRQQAGITSAKLASSTSLLGLPCVADETVAGEVHDLEALRRVLECAISQAPSAEAIAVMRAALNFGEEPTHLTRRREQVAEDLGGKHIDTIRNDEDLYFIGLVDVLAKARSSPCREVDLGRIVDPEAPFVGRDHLLADLVQLVESEGPPAVLLHGAPGVGKSALARHLAAALQASSSSTVAYVECRDRTFDECLFTLALQVMSSRALLYAARTTQQRVVAFKRDIGSRSLILVADDASDPDLVHDLAGLVDEGTVIVTSRRRDLLVSHGQIDIVVPDLTAGAIVEAIYAWAGLDPVEAVRAMVANELAQVTGGSPLAAKLVSPELRRGKSLTELIESLRARPVAIRGAQSPELNVQAALDLSLSRLGTPERKLFQALGSHPAGRGDADTLGAALNRPRTEVLGRLEILSLEHLLEHHHADGTWELHPLIATQLSRTHRSTAQRRRLLQYYAGRLADGRAALRTAGEHSWLSYLDAVATNIEGLIDWAVSNGMADLAAPATADLGWYWAIRGKERLGRDVIDRLLRLRAFRSASRARGHLHVAAAWLATNQSEYPDAAAHFEVAVDDLRATGNRDEVAQAVAGLAYALWGAGRYEDATALAQPLCTPRTPRKLRASALNVLGLCASHHSPPNFQEAEAWFEEALRLRRAIRDDWGVASVLGNLAEVCRASGRRPVNQLREMLEEALEIRIAHGDRWATANALSCLADLDLEEGAPGRAIARYAEASDIELDLDNPIGLATCCCGLAAVAHHLGLTGVAQRMLGETHALLQNVSVPLGPSHRRLLDGLEATLGPTRRSARPAAQRDILEGRIQAAIKALAQSSGVVMEKRD